MPIDTRMPEWMIRKNLFSDDKGIVQDLQRGMQIQQNQQQINQREREFQAAQELRTSQLRSLVATREAQINTQLMRQKQLEAEATDAAIVSAWMRDPRQPPPEGLQTPKGLKAVKDVQTVFAQSEIGSKFAAADKAFADQIKDLDAMGALRVRDAMDASNGRITPEIAHLIDLERARMQGASADIQILDETGEAFVKGSDRKPAFLRSTRTGALHRLPQDWSDQNPVVPLKDEQDKIIGYGVRNASGGITQLREQKSDEPTLTPAQRQTMNAEFGVVKQWWDDLSINDRRKPEMQAEMKKRLKEVENRYSTTKRVRVKSPDGKIGSIPESQLQDALKQGFTPAQ